jgi:hypothetical protein
MVAIEKTCRICGKIFIQRDGQSLSCSRECRYQAKVQHNRNKRAELRAAHALDPRPCAICATTFKPKNGDNIYCTRECYLVSRERTAQAKNNKRNRPDVPCYICGAMFSRKCIHQKVCSNRCSYRLRRRMLAERQGRVIREKVPCSRGCGGKCHMSLDGSPSVCVYCRRKVHQVEIKCEVCLKEFRPPKGNYVTCSKECSATHKRTYWRRKNADRRALRQSKKSSEAQAMAKKQPQKVWPCATCVHGIALPVSETGWMCNANAFACNPAWAKRLYQARA